MDSIWEMNLWYLIISGGPLMVPILLCSVISLAITIEKFFFFGSIQTNSQKFKKDIFSLLKDNKVKEAIAACEISRSPVAKI